MNKRILAAVFNRRSPGPASARIRQGGWSRTAFLRRLLPAGLGVVLGGSKLSRAADRDPEQDQSPTAPSATLVRLKGRPDFTVKQWHIITIGNLSRNRFWGESDERGVRPAICTCTLIRGEGFRLLVDPSLRDKKQMAAELDRRTGLSLSDIEAVFITHQHGDHHYGLAHFPEANWLAGPAVAEGLNKSERYGKTIDAVEGRIFGAVDIVPTPGHTLDHCSLRFDCAGLSVVVAGDAVPTRDFWAARRGYFNAVDFELSARTMDRIAALADVVVPGHDNSFLSLSPAKE